MTSGIRKDKPETGFCRKEKRGPDYTRLSTYDYELPRELIAQEPAGRRDESRLLFVRKSTGEINHHLFRDLPSLLDPSDLLIINETKVTPVSLTGYKPSGGRVDLLVVDPHTPLDAESGHSPVSRICLVRASKPLQPGVIVSLIGGPRLTVEGPVSPGRYRMGFPVIEADFQEFLQSHGRPPLPPYIKRDRGTSEEDRERYQTVYARIEGSVAAPTAGLHFTSGLLDELHGRGIQTARIILHVGPGTFTPVRHEDIRSHRMESEYYEISEETAEAINGARSANRRVIAVGTTSVRALESAATGDKRVEAKNGGTDLFVTPGYEFKVVGGLVTNFHLPRSTLLMLVSAFCGIEVIMGAYHEAIREEYRFYSYGDACLIL
ncbi:tRNA preQ1(34) S-adenosylmethionine ribosyltransferase-isomerase QueA [Thermodesulfobacteriota bacterium]